MESLALSSTGSQQKVIACKPFVKWAGGKSQLLPELIKRVPAKFGTYFEPFLGGGALFFALQPEQSMLSDINSELIFAYQAVAEKPQELIHALKKHEHNPDYYYKLREADRSSGYKRWSPLRKASRLIYLNKTCFNGLYRVNAKGEFNVPFGKYQDPLICDALNLTRCSFALRKAKILCAGFEYLTKVANKGDFVYFDPPYMPVSHTANFTSYAKVPFEEQLQIELSHLCKKLDSMGVKFMLSNSFAPLIAELYKGFHIEQVKANRMINSKKEKRGKVTELVIRNYA